MQIIDNRPMPQADSVTVRVAAARAAALAAELQRVRDRLAGAVSRDGWTGSARLAFDDALADRARMFGPVIDRYDGYAASLITYARQLESTLPGLRDARSRLTNLPRGPDDVAARQEFDRLWQDWDAARRRCAAALDRAGRSGADRHGLSALWHSATHIVHEVVSQVNLAEISRALSDLSDVLFVAALVLTPVPGVGEALWAAVAVVSVAKLAVDGVRRARGDASVSRGDLAWDAIGALPGGRVAKTAKEVERAARETTRVVRISERVEGLSIDATEVKLVPGGGLRAHEAPSSPIGHTLRKHVGKPYEYLVGRFKNPAITRSSTFYDRASAEHAMSGALGHADAHIQDWLASPFRRLRLTAESEQHIGVTVSRHDWIAVPTKRFRIHLEKDATMKLGYYIPTSYPMP